jgi:L-malate glycosyltransferase
MGSPCGGLRIGIISDRVEPFYRGGYERRFFEIAKRLSSKQEVHVFTSCPRDDQSFGNVRFHNIAPMFEYFSQPSRSITLDLAWSLGLSKILRYDLDVIDCNFTPILHVLPAILLSRLNGTKLALTVHELFSRNWLFDYFSTNINKYRYPILFSEASYIASLVSLRASAKVISVSKVTHDALQNNLGLQSSVVPNGIDFSVFKGKQTAVNDGSIRLVYTGRLVKEKGIDKILNAIAKLKRKEVIVKLKVIGMGPDQGRIEEQSKQLRLTEQVQLLGNLDEERKIEVLYQSDIFVMPSSREGFSIASLEALAAGLPIVAAVPDRRESSGILEIVKDGFNGLTYPSSNEDLLADRIEFLFKNPERRLAMGKNGLDFARNYDWAKIIPAYEDGLYELANQ